MITLHTRGGGRITEVLGFDQRTNVASVMLAVEGGRVYYRVIPHYDIVAKRLTDGAIIYGEMLCQHLDDIAWTRITCTDRKPVVEGTVVR